MLNCYLIEEVNNFVFDKTNTQDNNYFKLISSFLFFVNIIVKKILFLAASTILSVFPINAYSQTIEAPAFGGLSDNQQQQENTPLSESEFDAILTVACNRVFNSKKSIARGIKSELDASLSNTKLNELTKAVIEIKTLPSQERQELCQSKI